MKLVNKNDFNFDRSIFDSYHYFIITNKKFWDGGFDKSAPLEEKADFYSIAKQFSDIVKQLVIALEDMVLTGSHFSEQNKIFEFWKDRDSYDCFYNVSQLFKKNKQYKLELPDDNEYIDFIIENNFRYFTCFDLYLPNNKLVLQPTCHTEIIVYTYEHEMVKKIAQKIIEKYEGFSIKERYEQ